MILVTGATGMCGRAIVAQLLSAGYSVRAHARSQASIDRCFEHLPADTLFETSIADLADLSEEQAIKLCQGCSAIIHIAGLVHQANAEESLYNALNLSASKTLVDAAYKCGAAQFIYFSSTSVYGNRPTDMIDETAEPCADTPYARSKLATEDYLKAHSKIKSTVVLRPCLVFGEGDRGNMISLIRQVLSGKYFIVDNGDAAKSMIYAGDLARAVSAVIKSPQVGFYIYNIANPEPVSVKQLSQAIQAAGNTQQELISLPGSLVSFIASIANIVLGSRSPLSAERLAKLTRANSVSVSKFQNAYKFSPELDIETALAREINWARTEHLL